MNCIKNLIITGYTVKYTDLREPKPRTAHTEVFTLEKAELDALGLVGMNVADFITARYARCGYHVISVERIPARRLAFVDLYQLWAAAEPPAADEEGGNK